MAQNVVVFARADVEQADEGMLGDRKRFLSFELPTDLIKTNLQNFLASLSEILPNATSTKDGFGVDSFQVAVSINGKGQVGFLGTGGELGGSATLTLTFKRG